MCRKNSAAQDNGDLLRGIAIRAPGKRWLGSRTGGRVSALVSPIRRADAMSRSEVSAGAVAFSRSGSPDLGEFDDAVVLKSFGHVPDDFACGAA